MWLYLVALLGLYLLYRWYRERQTVENLTEKYVFITGCDSGFGNLLARQLDALGMRVLASCLTEKGAEQLEKATSERLRTTILDVTSTESVEAVTEWVKGCVGSNGLWGLVNNAGVGTPVAPNEWLTKDDFAKMININLLGLIDVTLHMLPLVKKARGRVVNVASVAGRLASVGGGYCPSKFGVEAFSDSLRRELHPFGVRVIVIEPGGFKTEMVNAVVDNVQNVWSRVPSAIKESYGQPYFEKYLQLNRTVIRTYSSHFCTVSDCMERALISCHPRTRYSAGWDARFLLIPSSYLPSSVADFIYQHVLLPKPAQAI